MNKKSTEFAFTDNDIRIAATLVRESMLSALPPPSECEHEFSGEFEEKMSTLIKQEYGRYARRTIIQRVAAVFLAISMGVSAWLAIDTKARANILQWIRDVYENNIVYRFYNVNPKQKLPAYSLGWIPDGFEEVDTFSNEHMRDVYYSNETGDMFVVTYFILNESTQTQYITSVDNKEGVKIGNIEGDYYAATGSSKTNNLIWIDEVNGIVFGIDSNMPKEVMLRIAENIVEK